MSLGLSYGKRNRPYSQVILNLSAHLEANGSLFKGNTVIFVGRCVDTPIDGQYIIDAEQIIGVLELDEEGN